MAIQSHSQMDFYQTCKTACTTLLLRTDVGRWHGVARGGAPPWDERNKIIANFIPGGSSVLDLGCGAQTLRSHLPPECGYQPCDIVADNPGVLFCDFNRGIYPRIAARPDYVVCSGVLEYIRKPRTFLARVSSLGDCLLLSYNARLPGESRLARLASGWLNHLSQDSLENLFDDLGIHWLLANVRSPNELLYLLRRPKPPHAHQARAWPATQGN